MRCVLLSSCPDTCGRVCPGLETASQRARTPVLAGDTQPEHDSHGAGKDGKVRKTQGRDEASVPLTINATATMAYWTCTYTCTYCILQAQYVQDTAPVPLGNNVPNKQNIEHKYCTVDPVSQQYTHSVRMYNISFLGFQYWSQW